MIFRGFNSPDSFWYTYIFPISFFPSILRSFEDFSAVCTSAVFSTQFWTWIRKRFFTTFVDRVVIQCDNYYLVLRYVSIVPKLASKKIFSTIKKKIHHCIRLRRMLDFHRTVGTTWWLTDQGKQLEVLTIKRTLYMHFNDTKTYCLFLSSKVDENI